MTDLTCADCGEYGHRTCDPTVTADLAADDAWQAHVIAEHDAMGHDGIGCGCLDVLGVDRVRTDDPAFERAANTARLSMDDVDNYAILPAPAYGLGNGWVAFVREADGQALWVGHHAYFADAMDAVRDVLPDAVHPGPCLITGPHPKGDCTTYIR
jgi:hypothetical protein